MPHHTTPADIDTDYMSTHDHRIQANPNLLPMWHGTALRLQLCPRSSTVLTPLQSFLFQPSTQPLSKEDRINHTPRLTANELATFVDGLSSCFLVQTAKDRDAYTPVALAKNQPGLCPWSK